MDRDNGFSTFANDACRATFQNLIALEALGITLPYLKGTAFVGIWVTKYYQVSANLIEDPGVREVSAEDDDYVLVLNPGQTEEDVVRPLQVTRPWYSLW